MTRLVWGPKPPEAQGLDRGVLYLNAGLVVPWNGLVSVDETTDEEVDTTMYFDGVRYTVTHKSGDFKAVLSAFTYPMEFEPYDGYLDVTDGQRRLLFNLSYRSGTQVHLVYNARALPTTKSRKTRGPVLDPSLFNWDLVAKPVDISGVKPSAHLVLDLEATDPSLISALEEMLYGSESSDPRMPSPKELLELYTTAATLIITDHGDGTWSATGPASMVQMLDDSTFSISTPSANYIREDATQNHRGLRASSASGTVPKEDTTYVIRSY